MAPPIVVTPQMYRVASRRTGVREELLRAVLGQESGGGRWVRSPKGAWGPAQLMPDTARGLEQRYGINTQTAQGNLLGGAYYLKEQLDRFGNEDLALAAYNAGPGAVQKYGGIPPYAETQNYVSSIRSKLGARRDATVAALSGSDAGTMGAPAARNFNPRAKFKPRPASQPAVNSIAASILASNNEIIGVPSPDFSALSTPAVTPPPLRPPVSRKTKELPGLGPNVPGKPVAKKILASAHSQIGKPYVWGGESRSEGGFDCSGLIYAAYLAQGIKIPRTTYEQVKVGKPIKWGQFRPGDLIFTNGGGHVVLYAGGGKVIAASRPGTAVHYQPLEGFRSSFYTARRYL
jgi:cell wall-associated NlpC family hydrolase